LKSIQWGSVAALALLMTSLMAGSYLLAFGVLISAFVVGVAYLIAVSEFEGQSVHPRRAHVTSAARD
jgi:hypothetical protein